jgi:hypothetical protein
MKKASHCSRPNCPSPLCPAVETFYIIFGNTMKGAPS